MKYSEEEVHHMGGYITDILHVTSDYSLIYVFLDSKEREIRSVLNSGIFLALPVENNLLWMRKIHF